ncbi:Protein Networked [Sesbania bispinosa]|nr:Protein Networked [Sesbania bispinosa]
MINHRSRESIKFLEGLSDAQNAEELRRTKTDIENNITKILTIIKNENQSKNDGIPKRSRKETELEGLIEDLNKQYQSLYTLYDRVTGEFERVVSRRRNRRTSVSSSDSDSEYFSSEEVDANKRRSEKEHQNVSDSIKHEPDRGVNTQVNDPNQKTESSVKAKEIEGQLASLIKEMESLSQQKKNLELQIESQANEVKQLNTKNTELHDQVLELELSLKEEKGVVSNLQVKFNENENQAKSNIAKLMAQVTELEQENKSLNTQKDEMEEKIKCDKNEASTQIKDLMEQLNVMQQNLDSLGMQNKELEAQMEIKSEQISEHLIQVENLEENLAQMRSIGQSMLEQKDGFLATIKDLQLELETRSNQKNELEEQLRDTSYEVKQLANENKALQDRNHDLKAAMTQRGEEISDFLKELEGDKNGASMEALSLEAEVNSMKLELDALHEQKSKLELQNERNQKEYAENLAKMETLNAKLETQIADQASTIDRIKAEQKQDKIMSNKLMANLRTTERKMEELVEEFRKKMEDNIRLLHQRIHVAEQLNNENKNSCKMTRQRYEEENKVLGEKIASYEKELKMFKARETFTPYPNGLELAILEGLDIAVGKVEEQRKCTQSRVSKMLCEVHCAKDWIKKRNEEMKQLKENVVFLKGLLNEKEEQESLLREKVWELEATLSKEGGEKLNLTKTVSQLEKKVGKLEKNVKEKDEDLICLGEKKREAIRQLCLVVDFHRDRCDHLKNLVTNMRLNKKT